VIERELRVQARRRATYYSRLGWGLAAVLMLAFLVAVAGDKMQDGAYLFTILHTSLAAMLLLVSPIVAADSISRERREGTLGLLLLTPLKPRQIVAGKFVSHALRLFYFWLMMLPFLTLPTLLGGIPWSQVLLSSALLLTVIIIGLGAGMMASAISVHFGAALVLALVFAALANQTIITMLSSAPYLAPTHNVDYEIPLSARLIFFASFLLFFPLNYLEFFQNILPTTRHLPEFLSVGLIFISILFLLHAFYFCTARLAWACELKIETAAQAAFRRKFLTPVLWKKTFRRSMARRLDKNPFIWLEYRTAWARAARWGALLLVVGADAALLTVDANLESFLQIQLYMLYVIAIVQAFKSANSFQYEKENGAFELILVTPMTEAKLVAGRLRAVASYFFPITLSLAVLTLVGLYWNRWQLPIEEPTEAIMILTFWLSLASGPAAGLFFALLSRNFLTAVAWTAGFVFFGPPLLWSAFMGILWTAAHQYDNSIAIILEHAIQNHWRSTVIVATLLYHLALIYCSRKAAIRLFQRRAFANQKPA
jgi:ABC-type transport system involved in multi-copper enzyme maturation permease subunit